jgi:hypothetical protein
MSDRSLPQVATHPLLTSLVTSHELEIVWKTSPSSTLFFPELQEEDSINLFLLLLFW